MPKSHTTAPCGVTCWNQCHVISSLHSTTPQVVAVLCRMRGQQDQPVMEANTQLRKGTIKCEKFESPMTNVYTDIRMANNELQVSFACRNIHTPCSNLQPSPTRSASHIPFAPLPLHPQTLFWLGFGPASNGLLTVVEPFMQSWSAFQVCCVGWTTFQGC